MKLPIIEYAVDLNGTVLCTATTEEQALRFVRTVQEAASPGLTLVGALSIQPVKREIEVATMADIDVRLLDREALAVAYDTVQVAKAAALVKPAALPTVKAPVP